MARQTPTPNAAQPASSIVPPSGVTPTTGAIVQIVHGDQLGRFLVAPDGQRIFPASTNVSAATILTQTNIAPRLGATYDFGGQGKIVLKAFYGRYVNNLADGFSAINPGGQSIAQ